MKVPFFCLIRTNPTRFSGLLHKEKKEQTILTNDNPKFKTQLVFKRFFRSEPDVHCTKHGKKNELLYKPRQYPVLAEWGTFTTTALSTRSRKSASDSNPGHD